MRDVREKRWRHRHKGWAFKHRLPLPGGCAGAGSPELEQDCPRAAVAPTRAGASPSRPLCMRPLRGAHWLPVARRSAVFHRQPGHLPLHPSASLPVLLLGAPRSSIASLGTCHSIPLRHFPSYRSALRGLPSPASAPVVHLRSLSSLRHFPSCPSALCSLPSLASAPVTPFLCVTSCPVARRSAVFHQQPGHLSLHCLRHFLSCRYRHLSLCPSASLPSYRSAMFHHQLRHLSCISVCSRVSVRCAASLPVRLPSSCPISSGGPLAPSVRAWTARRHVSPPTTARPRPSPLGSLRPRFVGVCVCVSVSLSLSLVPGASLWPFVQSRLPPCALRVALALVLRDCAVLPALLPGHAGVHGLPHMRGMRPPRLSAPCACTQAAGQEWVGARGTVPEAGPVSLRSRTEHRVPRHFLTQGPLGKAFPTTTV